MEDKSKVTPKKVDDLFTIEALAKKSGVSPAVFAGVKLYKGWSAGKQVTEKAFGDAVKAFGKAPIRKKGVK